VRTLTGEYVARGVNHGRKVYQKVSDGSPNEVSVLLYFWDTRDGPSFEGWWFGNKLGGTQVWSHNKDSSLLPPTGGWQIPWDGPVRESIVVVNKEVRQMEMMKEKGQQLAAEITKLESEATQAVGQARESAAKATPESLAEVEKILGPHATSVEAISKRLEETQKGSPPELARGFQQLRSRVNAMINGLKNEITKAKTAREKMETEEKQKAAEERDAKVLEEILPEATEKTNAAEDAVEKCGIVAEMIAACGDDVDVVKQAIEDTERGARTAQAAIGEARIFLNAKLANTRRFAEKAKETASAELGKLQQKLQEAQNKLNPLKVVRQEWEERRIAMRLVAEVEEKLVLAEVDVDKAEELIAVLQSDVPTKEALDQVKHALQMAEEHINQTMRVFDNKKQSAKGVPLEELMKLGPRGEAAKKRVMKLRTSLKEAGERVTIEGYLTEAEAKVQAVTEALAKLEEIEAQFQDSTECSLEEVMTAVRSSEGAAATAQTASSVAKMFIQMKMLEVKRFSSGPSSEASAKFADYQGLLESSLKRLGELRACVGRRKRTSLVREAETQVSKAEQLVENVKQVAAVFSDDSKLMELSPEEIREASERTAAAEKEASDAIMEVRKFVTAGQIEIKGKDAGVEMSSELIKFQTRLAAAQTEVGKQRKLFTSVEQRLALKRQVEEAEKKLVATEEKVQKAADAVAALMQSLPGDGDNEGKDPNSGVKEAEQLMQEAQIAVKQTRHFLDSQLRVQGFGKDAVGQLNPRLKDAQDKVDAASASMRERSERLMVSNAVREAKQKVADCEASLAQAVEAEQPFQEAVGGEVDATKQGTLLATLEKQLQSTQQVANGAKTAIAMKKLHVKRLSEGPAKTATEELSKLQSAVDDAVKKIAEMRVRCGEWKKSALRRDLRNRAPIKP